ncbi:MAG: disulfide bond formation protein B, partial [Chromatiales bacterium]
MQHARLMFLVMFLICAALLGFGYYLQYVTGLEPCPLCIFQRVCFILLGATALVAFLHNPAALGARVYASLASVSTLAGIVFAGRQVWLQHLPPEKVPACGPGLEYWMQTLPVTETLRKVFRGSGECAEVDWTFFGLSIAEWSLLWFALFL